MGDKSRQNDPIEMLERCHNRMLDESEALCAALASPARLEDADFALGFFERQGVRHERDEEESLFPRLRGRMDDRLLDDLARQHREHERLVGELRSGLDAGDAVDAPALLALAEKLRESYRDHIELEENGLIPAARKLLTADEMAAALEEMQARRGR